jgi:hypothetical protein
MPAANSGGLIMRGGIFGVFAEVKIGQSALAASAETRAHAAPACVSCTVFPFRDGVRGHTPPPRG